MKKSSLFMLLLSFALTMGCSKKSDPSPSGGTTETLIAKTWNLTGLTVKTDVKSYPIPVDASSDLSTITFDGKGKYTLVDAGVTKPGGTYTLSSEKLTLSQNGGISFYITSITDKSLSFGMVGVNTSKSVSSLTDEENYSLFLSGLLLSTIGIEYDKITPVPKTIQTIWVFAAK